MKQHLRKKRDFIIRNEYAVNLNQKYPLGKTEFFDEIKEIFSNPPSVPSFFRIIRDIEGLEAVEFSLSLHKQNQKIINKAIKKI